MTPLQPGPNDPAPASKPQDLLPARLVGSLISLVISGLGAMSVWTEHYYGQTSKLGGSEISLDGPPAVAMGFFFIFLGLIPLSFWCRGKRSALTWTVFCLTGAGTAVFFASHMRFA